MIPRRPSRAVRPRAGWMVWILLLSLPGLLPAAENVRFNRDIRPLLSDNCMSCHGPDPGSRKAGLRLDTKEGLFESTPKRGPAVVPGKPDQSELWKRVITTDQDDLMPPPDSHKELKPAQRELIRRWIEDGANWEPHWSFIPPHRSTPPTPSNPQWVRNPIDAFVLAKLDSRGLKPAPEADRRTLARRLALDLTGLPPTPEQVETFVQDPAPDYYERYVESLMHSPQWGEHRARYWLDAARYADTHGLHFDNYREMWPYRDWVIRAFNRNQPFDRFTLEQLAGDLLPDATLEQRIATGFQRCNATTNEGGTIEEENLANYANDRVSTTSWVWLGLTANCAACHDHKFDPVTMKDFYSMAAFFRNTTQSGFDRNRRESDVSIVAPVTEQDQKRWEALPSELKVSKEKLDREETRSRERLTQWLMETGSRSKVMKRNVELPGEYLRLPLNEGKGRSVQGKVEGSSVRFALGSNATWRADGPHGSGLVLTKTNTLDLGPLADFERWQPFSVGAWIYVPTNYSGNWSIIGRVLGDKDRGSRYAGWDLALQDGFLSLVMTRTWSSSAMKTRASERKVPTGRWVHVMATYDGSTRAGGIKMYLDGLSQKTSGDLDNLEGSVRVKTPLRLGQREYGDFCQGLAIQDLRIYTRELDATESAAVAWSGQARSILAKEPAARTEAETQGLAASYLLSKEENWVNALRNHQKLRREKQDIYGRSPVAHIQVEKTNASPTAFVLFRGQYDKPKDQVGPATFAALNPMPAGAPSNRLGLAQWLIAPENPLMARVTVNRFWQELFGTGFVKTSEDFGIMGELPTHPELLDWLAVEFREKGWDVKHLFRLMVTSATYRQATVLTPEKVEKDPANRFFSRGPRFRMDAEMVRDYALAASGLLVRKVGGASVKPYQPVGVWEAVAMPESNTRYYQQDSGEALYRRSMYTFWKRAAPPATLDLFNAPARESCTVRRERTNTPLQALATMNDPQFVEAARALAAEALRRNKGRTEAVFQDMAARLLARPLNPEELDLLRSSYADYLKYYEAKPAAAREFLTVGESRVPEKLAGPRLAAMTMVANNLMNLDEVLNK